MGELTVHHLSHESQRDTLSLQTGIPAGPFSTFEIDIHATRVLGRCTSQWTKVPSVELKRTLRGLAPLEMCFRLVQPREFE